VVRILSHSKTFLTGRSNWERTGCYIVLRYHLSGLQHRDWQKVSVRLDAA